MTPTVDATAVWPSGRMQHGRAKVAKVQQAADAKRAGDNEGKRRAIAAMNELDTRFREMPAARRRATAWNQFVESGEAARRLGGRRR